MDTNSSRGESTWRSPTSVFVGVWLNKAGERGMPDSDEEGRARRHRYPERRTALAVVALSVAFAGAGLAVYAAHQPSGIDLVKLQWWAGAPAKVMDEIRHQPPARFRTALYWDAALILGYSVSLSLACLLGRWVFWPRRFRAWATWGWWALAAVAVGNIAQDLLL